METNKEKCKILCPCQIEGKTHSMNDGCGCPAHNYVDKQQNQCDGCLAGMKLKDGIHYSNGKVCNYCTKDRYHDNN